MVAAALHSHTSICFEFQQYTKRTPRAHITRLVFSNRARKSTACVCGIIYGSRNNIIHNTRRRIIMFFSPTLFEFIIRTRVINLNNASGQLFKNRSRLVIRLTILKYPPPISCFIIYTLHISIYIYKCLYCSRKRSRTRSLCVRPE